MNMCVCTQLYDRMFSLESSSGTVTEARVMAVAHGLDHAFSATRHMVMPRKPFQMQMVDM